MTGLKTYLLYIFSKTARQNFVKFTDLTVGMPVNMAMWVWPWDILSFLRERTQKVLEALCLRVTQTHTHPG